MIRRRLCAVLVALALAAPLAAQPSKPLKPAAGGVSGAGISGTEVLRLTQQLLAVAPKRYIGSPGHAAAEKFIRDHFAPEAAKGDFITDAFYARTPIGMLPMSNFIVKYPGRKPGVIVLASHYETNYWLKDIDFVGANDGACTSALLIALGQYLRTHPPQGYSVWLLFDDGEESITPQWSDSDSLYGTRHIAAKWSADGTLPLIKAFVVADMIGWKKMNITRDGNSTPWLLDLLAQAGRETGYSSYLFRDSEPIDDDHIPFKQRGVPVLDIIDYKYGTSDDPEAYHHTVQDTFDKLSAKSLQVSGDLFLAVIRLIDQH
jgi:Zn-dependent M28 family amino/carboxypeptidase